jgi:ribonuclease HI
MAKKDKYYVVWRGHKTGIYRSWAECAQQIKGFTGARYQSFNSKVEAEIAFQSEPPTITLNKEAVKTSPTLSGVIWNSISVDAACSGNPGTMEYRGVDTQSREVLFEKKFSLGTNNIGEFLAIVHALALTKKQTLHTPIYSDSQTALIWVKHKKCKTKLERSKKTEELYEIIDRAEKWLRDNQWENELLKWETEAWGEIPADFGRKS